MAYLLDISPDVERIRKVVHKRLLEPKQREKAEKNLESMLLTLHTGDYVVLDPEPPAPVEEGEADQPPETDNSKPAPGSLGALMLEQLGAARAGFDDQAKDAVSERDAYRPVTATPTEKLSRLLGFRSINPLYGDFVIQHIGKADECERLQLLESVLGVPGSLMRSVRVPNPDRMPAGPLANEYLNSELLTRGLATQAEIVRQEEDDGRFIPFEDRVFVLSLAEKLLRLFHGDFPEVRDVVMDPVWIAGELLNCGGDFNKYVTSNDLTKHTDDDDDDGDDDDTLERPRDVE